MRVPVAPLIHACMLQKREGGGEIKLEEYGGNSNYTSSEKQ